MDSFLWIWAACGIAGCTVLVVAGSIFGRWRDRRPKPSRGAAFILPEDNGGRACARCHTSARRPCRKCHVFLPTAGHGTSWAKDHQSAKSAVACDSCHAQWKGMPGRDFCKLCHGVRVDQ